MPVCPPSFLPAAHDIFLSTAHLPALEPARCPPACAHTSLPSFLPCSVSRCRCCCCCAALLLQQCPRSVHLRRRREHHLRRRHRHTMVDDALDLIPKPKSPISLTALLPGSFVSVHSFWGVVCLEVRAAAMGPVALHSFSCLSICLSTVEDSPPR